MVILRPLNLRWIHDAVDDPMDLCAHGDVEFRIGDDLLLSVQDGNALTVSAAALYLLRTLSTPHTREAPVGDHLFPCCGFAMYDVAAEPDVVVCGCPNGHDFEVRHQGSGDGVVVQAGNGCEWSVSWPDWQAAVFAFADRVSEFYAACSPKEPFGPEETAGVRKFAAEWVRRRGTPLSLTFRRS
jgi:hypothetical protein